MFDDDNEKKLLETCAQLATWQFMESDPVEKERLGKELEKYLDAAAEARAERISDMEKNKDEKAAQVESEDKPEAKEKAEAEANSELEKNNSEREESDVGQPERVLELMLEIPDYIKNSAAYQQVLEDQRTVQYERISAQSDPYERAAKALEAEPLDPGQEIDGEVVEVAKVNGKNYYVIEQDGERFAVPSGDEPEFEKGDEIAVSRTKEGFEAGETYDHGR